MRVNKQMLPNKQNVVEQAVIYRRLKHDFLRMTTMLEITVE